MLGDSYTEEFATQGYILWPAVMPESVLGELDQALESAGTAPGARIREGVVFGMRNVLSEVPTIRRVALGTPLVDLVEPLLGPRISAVRGLLFDKNKAANWRLGWHRDRAVAVQSRQDVPGFGPWSVKDGVDHVFAPTSVLRRMVTIRLHLDDCDETSGALKVVPGSHLTDGSTESDLQSLADSLGIRTCAARRGDVLAMSPLLVHGSDKCDRPTSRRILHIEYTSTPLPKPLEWWENHAPEPGHAV